MTVTTPNRRTRPAPRQLAWNGSFAGAVIRVVAFHRDQATCKPEPEAP